MSHIVLASEMIVVAGVALKVCYSKWQSSKLKKISALFSADHKSRLIDLQSVYGYNEHSLLSISSKRKMWVNEQTDSAVSYSEHGKICLAAGETIAAEKNIASATEFFLQTVRDKKKIAAFLPVTEKFARIVTQATKLKAVKIGALPCFDLQNWNPRGNKAKHLRAGLNQARRQQIRVEEIVEVGESLRRETADLCREWLKTRRSIVKFGWLFELSPFQNAEKKKFFAARSQTGKLLGFLAASPIPAREGWYLEDVLRSPEAPNGTAELLVFETMKILTAQGAKFATLGTAPLAEDGEDLLSSNNNLISRQIIKFCRNHLNGFYNFKGIRNFKAKFAPCHWESQYVLIPKGIFTPMRVLETFIYLILWEK